MCRYSPMNRLLQMLLGSLVLSLTASASDIYPVARRGGLPNNLWTSAGIPDPWPRVSTVNTTLSSSSTLSQINAAIAACPSNQIVQLGPGTFNVNGMINLTKNGVVLRGSTNSAGFPTTILNGACITMSPYWYPGGGNGGWPAISVRDVTGGLTEGSTSLTVSATPGADFAVGDIMFIDQLDDGVLVAADIQNNDLFMRSGRSYQESVHITGVNGTTITFEPPLLGTYWNQSLTPQIVGWSSQLGHSAYRIGLENVDIAGDCGNIYTIRGGPGYQCWVRNVRAQVHSNGAAIRVSYFVNSELTHSIFHDAPAGQGSNTYGINASACTSSRFEDNSFYNLSLAMVYGSAVGCSFSYNYGTGPYPYSQQNWLAEYFFSHGGHPHHNIFEGNWLDGPIEFDDIFHNNNSDNGIVRNRIKGWANGKVGNTTPIFIGEPNGSGNGNHRNTTIIGNILGEDSYHTSYSQMYHVEPECSGTITVDNYNTVDDAVNAAEAIGSNTMRDSYTYASKPTWFGNLTWPPFDPANFGSATATSIPAGYRYVNGVDPGSGPVPTPSPTPVPTPHPPQGLHVVP